MLRGLGWYFVTYVVGQRNRPIFKMKMVGSSRNIGNKYQLQLRNIREEQKSYILLNSGAFHRVSLSAFAIDIWSSANSKVFMRMPSQHRFSVHSLCTVHLGLRQNVYYIKLAINYILTTHLDIFKYFHPAKSAVWEWSWLHYRNISCSQKNFKGMGLCTWSSKYYFWQTFYSLYQCLGNVNGFPNYILNLCYDLNVKILSVQERLSRDLSCSFRSKTSRAGFSTLFIILALIYVTLYSTILKL